MRITLGSLPGVSSRAIRGLFRLDPERVKEFADFFFHIRIGEVVQKIVAAKLSAAQARILRSRPGKPALHVTRQYFDANDRLLMATVGLYPSDRFSHNTRFRIQNADQKETA